MIYVVPILYGIGCGWALWSARSCPDARNIASSLVVLWALANAAWVSDTLMLLPVLDFWLGVIAVMTWWTTRAKWVALIVNAVAIRLVLHVLDALTGHVFFAPYAHALNATFAWMLVVVATSGGGYDRGNLLRWLRRIRGLLPAAAREVTRGNG